MAYAVIAYHDEPEDAATDSRAEWPFATVREARAAAARLRSDPRWNGGAGIYSGTYDPGRLGVRPEGFEYDDLGPRYSTWGDGGAL